MKDELKNTLLNDGFDAYLFYTPIKGHETVLCEKLNNRYQNAYFLTLRKMMHRSKEGIKWDEQVSLLEQYLFVYVKKAEPIDFLLEISSMTYVQDIKDGSLKDDNLAYARWILTVDGLLGISTAVIENGLVKITGGPLLQIEDQIVKYSKRNRNCFVSLDIAGVKIETWLPFDWRIENKT